MPIIQFHIGLAHAMIFFMIFLHLKCAKIKKDEIDDEEHLDCLGSMLIS